MDPITLLADLVSVNSINPSLVPGAPGEKEAAEVVRRALTFAGLDVVLQEVCPGRANVVGILEGRNPGPTLMFCGHLDTVGVEGMVNPFSPRIENGRLYGRGAQDMKGGVAAMIAAAADLASNWKSGRLIVAAVIDEEFGSLGAEALVKKWSADAAIITEPTDLAVAIAHRGYAWLEIATKGRAAHGSRPKEGIDAILHMGRVLNELEDLDRSLQAKIPDPVQGVASLHASRIIGGSTELSTYPDRCTLQMERRTLTAESDQVITDEIEAILTKHRDLDPHFHADVRLLASRPAYKLDASHRLPQTLLRALAEHGKPGAPIGMSFWTDAAILGSAGIPTVLFGPGGAGLHSVVEYVNLDEVIICRDVLVATARSYMEKDIIP